MANEEEGLDLKASFHMTIDFGNDLKSLRVSNNRQPTKKN